MLELLCVIVQKIVKLNSFLLLFYQTTLRNSSACLVFHGNPFEQFSDHSRSVRKLITGNHQGRIRP